MQNNEEVMCMLDGSWGLEQEWFRHMSEVGVKDLLQSRVSKIFCPTADFCGYLNAAEVVSQLEDMKRTPAYEYAEEDAQSSVTIPLEWASAVAGQRQPSFKALKDSNYLKDIQGFMHQMLMYSVDPPSEGSSKDQVPVAEPVCYGIQAMEKLFGAMDLRVKTAAVNAPIDLGDLKVFDTFAFLMNASQKATQREWIGKCFKSHGARASAQAPPQPQTKTAVKKEAAREGSSTSSLFKKKRTGDSDQDQS